MCKKPLSFIKEQMLELGKLTAVVTHLGPTMLAGHYKVYLMASGAWWEMDNGDSYRQADPFENQKDESISLLVFKK